MLGAHVQRWSKRDWAEWDAEHEGDQSARVAEQWPEHTPAVSKELGGFLSVGLDNAMQGVPKGGLGNADVVDANRALMTDMYGQPAKDLVGVVQDITGPTAYFTGGRTALGMAPLYLAADQSTSEVPLYRGMMMTMDDATKLAQMKPGDVIPVKGGASFSADKGVAEEFASGMTYKGDTDNTAQVMIHMEPGAHAVDISNISNTPYEAEHVSTSDMEVTKIEPSSGRLDVYVKAKP